AWSAGPPERRKTKGPATYEEIPGRSGSLPGPGREQRARRIHADWRHGPRISPRPRQYIAVLRTSPPPIPPQAHHPDPARQPYRNREGRSYAAVKKDGATTQRS